MLALALAGKPNAGKSTFYQAATMADVDVANYPFTTIDANRGISHVRTECPCLDLDERCDSDHCHDGTRYVPVELYDVAGLVPGPDEPRARGRLTGGHRARGRPTKKVFARGTDKTR